MAVVHMVQPAIHQPVDMSAMRHGIMAAARPMDMAAGGWGPAAVGIGVRHRNHMFIDMIAVHVVQMAIVQIIDMVTMLNGDMAAGGAMHMAVVWMGMRASHCCSPSFVGRIARQRLPLSRSGCMMRLS
jgi:hypothetical protein